MYKIANKEKWHDILYSMKIDVPDIARKAKPGQFVILMTEEKGERIPLTLADYNREEGWIQLVFQVVGKSTKQLSLMEEGESLYSVVGPLGNPSEIENYGTVVTVGGGTGIACVHPITRALKKAGNKVIAIIGARTKGMIIMEDQMREASDELLITTDDGSYVRKGFVTEVLEEVLQRDESVEKIWAIGPAIMMKAVCEVSKPYDVDTIVSLNSIMVDGTGMCGSCRVSVGGETKFACVDGPEFSGHLVDWEGFMDRSSRFCEQEEKCLKAHEEELEAEK